MGDSRPVLTGISVVIKRGMLVGVTGQSGSGKSSFLLSLLGELQLAKGSCIIKYVLTLHNFFNIVNYYLHTTNIYCTILNIKIFKYLSILYKTFVDLLTVTCRRGSMCFVPSSPWFGERSIRKYILGSNQFDSGKYESALASCALDNLLTGGNDMSMGDSKALTAGDLCRIALAKAVYADRDIYLIDDIFRKLI